MTNRAHLYEQDFYAWTQQQAQALGNRQLTSLDWEHLQEEIASLGKQEYRELVSRLTVLLGHLLKWDLQPEKRCRSWFLTIREQRRAIERHLRHNPSLKVKLAEAVAEGFEGGVDLALRETELPLRFFPSQSPYHLLDILNLHFLCDTSQDWES